MNEHWVRIGTEPASLRRRHTERAIDRICVRDGEVPLLAFPLLEEQGNWMTHGFTTRFGGVSEGGCAALNLSYTREADRSRVDENFCRLAKSGGFAPEDMVFSFQTHTTNVRVVTEEDRGKGFARARDYKDVDALVTDVPGLTLITFYGDCVPLLVADPVRRVIGAAHSGWRGTLANIGGELVRTMRQIYGCNPENLVAAIGPSICPDCFEVGPEVADAFRTCMSADAFERVCRPSSDAQKRAAGKAHVNLQEVCRLHFLAEGLLEDRISVPDVCTCCNADLLFSHRGSPAEHGLMAAYMRIQNKKSRTA